MTREVEGGFSGRRLYGLCLGSATLNCSAVLGQLVEAMAEALNVPSGTVVQFDRVLAQEGLRSKSGRGLSAGRVSARDATNLHIAIALRPSRGLQSKTPRRRAACMDQ